MKKINFVKAYTRLGMINIPYKGEKLNLGVEFGADYILDQKFLKNFPDKKILTYKFPLPEAINRSDYFKEIYKASLEFSRLIVKNQEQNPGMDIIVGGDHSLGLGSALAQLEIYGDKLGLIHIDSHEDACSVKSSTTQNFHGMYIRALTDKDFDDEYIKQIPYHLNPSNLLIIGNIDCAQGEEGAYLREKDIKYFEKKDIQDNKEYFFEYLNSFMKRFEHIHVSFDIDVFDKSLVAATGTPSDNGFLKSDIFPVLEIIKTHRSISMDLAEVNPKLTGAIATIDMAQEVIDRLAN